MCSCELCAVNVSLRCQLMPTLVYLRLFNRVFLRNVAPVIRFLYLVFSHLLWNHKRL